MRTAAALPIVPSAVPAQPPTISAAPTISAETSADLHHAVLWLVQKEQRHRAARREYFTRFHDAAVTPDERARLFDALRFAADELRRARAHFDEVKADAVRQGARR